MNVLRSLFKLQLVTKYQSTTGQDSVWRFASEDSVDREVVEDADCSESHPGVVALFSR